MSGKRREHAEKSRREASLLRDLIDKNRDGKVIDEAYGGPEKREFRSAGQNTSLTSYRSLDWSIMRKTSRFWELMVSHFENVLPKNEIVRFPSCSG